MYGRNSYLGEGFCTHGVDAKTCTACPAERDAARRAAAAPELYQACLAAWEELNTYWKGDYAGRPVARLLEKAVAAYEGQ